MDYPNHIVGWLADRLEAVEWQYTPLEILETDSAYPGLWEALDVEIWQRRLVKEQVSDE